jgi:hypothetical protein
VVQDGTKEMEWYRKAIEQGNCLAQSNFGALFEVNRGVPVDKVKAMEWHKQADDHGDVEAKNGVDDLEQQGYSLLDKEIASLLYVIFRALNGRNINHGSESHSTARTKHSRGVIIPAKGPCTVHFLPACSLSFPFRLLL